jgi:hypothetical protein
MIAPSTTIGTQCHRLIHTWNLSLQEIAQSDSVRRGVRRIHRGGAASGPIFHLGIGVQIGSTIYNLHVLKAGGEQSFALVLDLIPRRCNLQTLPCFVPLLAAIPPSEQYR